MIVIASKEEKELLQRLRAVGFKDTEKVGALSGDVLKLKKDINELHIEKSKIVEEHDKQERELRHMIGLEKKRQEFEIKQTKAETSLEIREGNLKAEKDRFAENLKFNTERFEKMESYLKDMMKNILERLPNVNASLKLGNRK
jgi:hypothetical protein